MIYVQSQALGHPPPGPKRDINLPRQTTQAAWCRQKTNKRPQRTHNTYPHSILLLLTTPHALDRPPANVVHMGLAVCTVSMASPECWTKNPISWLLWTLASEHNPLESPTSHTHSCNRQRQAAQQPCLRSQLTEAHYAASRTVKIQEAIRCSTRPVTCTKLLVNQDSLAMLSPLITPHTLHLTRGHRCLLKRSPSKAGPQNCVPQQHTQHSCDHPIPAPSGTSPPTTLHLCAASPARHSHGINPLPLQCNLLPTPVTQTFTPPHHTNISLNSPTLHHNLPRGSPHSRSWFTPAPLRPSLSHVTPTSGHHG
jgi:hypothetical protein